MTEKGTGFYEPLADLIERHKDKLARQIAAEITARKLRLYSEFNLEQLIKLAIPALEETARYVRSGNIAEYRQYVKQRTAERRKQGYSMEEINAGGTIIGTKIIELVKREYPDPASETTRLAYIRRIEGLTNLGRASAHSALIEKDN
jgi:hypothetical protein